MPIANTLTTTLTPYTRPPGTPCPAVPSYAAYAGYDHPDSLSCISGTNTSQLSAACAGTTDCIAFTLDFANDRGCLKANATASPANNTCLYTRSRGARKDSLETDGMARRRSALHVQLVVCVLCVCPMHIAYCMSVSDPRPTAVRPHLRAPYLVVLLHRKLDPLLEDQG